LRQTIGNVRGQVGSGRLRLEENELLVWLGTNFSRAASVASPSKLRGKKRGNGVDSMLEEEKGGMGLPCGGRGHMEEGSGAAVGWLTATLEWRLRAGGGANALHGCVPTDRGGGATDVWS
jgi:hypothetical protein